MTSDPLFEPGPTGPLRLEQPLGSRVLVVGDLLLGPSPTTATSTTCAELIAGIRAFEGPGTIIVAGNTFASDLDGQPQQPERCVETLALHHELFEELARYHDTPGRSVVVLPGWRDPQLLRCTELADAFGGWGITLAEEVELHLKTSTGTKVVAVRGAAPGDASPMDLRAFEERPWLAGIDRLDDPGQLSSFITSRATYRRLGRLLWVPPLVAMFVVLAIAAAPIYDTISRLVRRSHKVHHVFDRVHSTPWSTRLLFLLAVLIVSELLVGFLAAIVTRRLYQRELGGLGAPTAGAEDLGVLSGRSSHLTLEGQPALDAARQRIAHGDTGLIVGGGLDAELIHLSGGFYAACGGSGEVVRAHEAHLGLPRIYRHHRQRTGIELECGATLQVRLYVGEVDLPTTTRLERLASKEAVVKGYKASADLDRQLVASWPTGGSWPRRADLIEGRRRIRRIRRLVATAIFVVGLVDILLAIAPPLRDRLHVVDQVLPLGVAQAAGALVGLAGLGLMMLARGILRGQRRPWFIAIVLLSITSVLHLVHAASFGGVVVSTAVLVVALVERRCFTGATDSRSARSSLWVVVVGVVVAIGGAMAGAQLTPTGHQVLPSLWNQLTAFSERLVGITTIKLPDLVDDWTTPSLIAIGVCLVLVALYLFTRPVVDRRLGGGGSGLSDRAADEARARDIVRRHGRGTLDYFALRDDKQFFFHRDSLVAYAVFGGICIASPDPIGPLAERDQVFDAFRRFADAKGWGIGVVGAAEEWLTTYREAGMRQIYVGDEALVDVQTFSLAGGKMKGLRQACTRVERNGYTIEFLDPSSTTTAQVAELVPLLEANRRGDEERGFSMMLGRMFDQRDEGLLLTVVRDAEGVPAAVCQFVPSSAINGYSLDLMRRDGGEHPNGLLDFALCSTIAKLREDGAEGLSLNFAVLRSALEADDDASIIQRLERWALLRLSGYLQIESLWKFNAKYEPTWQPRYIVYDSPEQFLPSVISFLRAESVSDIPVLGKLFASNPNKRATSVVVGSGAAAPPAR